MSQNKISLRHYDMFGYPVSLFYRGESSYKTQFGGVLSIISSLVFITCLLFKLMHQDYDSVPTSGRRMLLGPEDQIVIEG